MTKTSHIFLLLVLLSSMVSLWRCLKWVVGIPNVWEEMASWAAGTHWCRLSLLPCLEVDWCFTPPFLRVLCSPPGPAEEGSPARGSPSHRTEPALPEALHRVPGPAGAAPEQIALFSFFRTLLFFSPLKSLGNENLFRPVFDGLGQSAGRLPAFGALSWVMCLVLQPQTPTQPLLQPLFPNGKHCPEDGHEPGSNEFSR